MYKVTPTPVFLIDGRLAVANLQVIAMQLAGATVATPTHNQSNRVMSISSATSLDASHDTGRATRSGNGTGTYDEIAMAAGEYVSMKAQTELLEHELKREQHELAHRPEFERRELISIYEARGVSHDTAVLVTDELMSSPEQALETHAREEMGVDPNNLGSPIGAAVSSFIAFCIGAIVPLAPWFFGSGTAAVLASIMLTVVSAIIIGATLANFSGRSPIRGALRQLVLTSAAAAVTYAIGSFLGT